MALSRRSFIGLSTAGLLAGYLGSHVTSNARIEAIDLHVNKLPPNLQGFKIAYLSDFHLGPWLTQEQCHDLILPLKEHAPDLILLGGDYILSMEGLIGGSLHSAFGRADLRTPYQIYSETVTLCRELFEPQFGIYGVLGNHDNWAQPLDCKKAFTDAGATLLVNELSTVQIQSDFTITLVGTDDFWTGNSQFPSLPSSTTHYKILLSHNPDGVQYLIDRGARFNLALCGHTHGGQIKLPFLGPVLYNCRDARLREGMFTSKDFSVYTSRGIGAVEIPLRINCPPELTLLRLIS